MKPLHYGDIKNVQLVDIRPQAAFQEGYIKESLNLIPRNFETYGDLYIDKEEDLIFVTDEDNKEDLKETIEIANQKGFTNLIGYIFIENIPEENLLTLETVAASDFLDKKEDYILLDVRHPDEITRPAPESNLVNIPFQELNQRLEEIDTNKKVFTLCGSGNRSTAASSYLESEGYETSVIEGGMKMIQDATH